MDAVSVVLLANWGLGVELLDAFAAMPRVRVAAVVTRRPDGSPDPWAGAVWERALALGVPVHDQDALDAEAMRRVAADSGADLLAVHAYMRRLPASVYLAPRLGGINIHASLLPRHRGPSPHHWSIASGDARTGLTSHYLDEGMDTGPIIYQLSLPIRQGDAPADLVERVKGLAAPLLRETVRRVLDPDFKPVLQDENLATYAPRPGA